jgi:predicted alpha/beta hydrolase
MIASCRIVSYTRLIFSDLEAVAGHALSILTHEVGAFLLGVAGGGEEHALVALRFLFGTNTAWLGLQHVRTAS